jgi:hypothetical protein
MRDREAACIGCEPELHGTHARLDARPEGNGTGGERCDSHEPGAWWRRSEPS